MPLDSVPLDLEALPGIVCGPVLRRLTRTSVSVWVACLEPDPITLTVRRRGVGAPPEASVTTTPTRVGANLWITVLTAGAPGGTFEAGRIYEYELTRGVGGDARIDPVGRPCRWRERRGRRSSLRRRTRPSSSSTTRRAGSPTAAGATGLSLALMDMATRFQPGRRRSRICWSCRATRSTPTRSATR